jgi:uncharacterized integral membrane protein
MSRFVFRTFLVLAALAALVISALNAGAIEIELAFARIATPLGVALVVAFTIGLLAGVALQSKWVAQLLAERGRLRRALRIAEAKVRVGEAAR